MMFFTLNYITIEEDDNVELPVKEDVEEALLAFKPTVDEKATKGQTLANFLVDHHFPDKCKFFKDLSDNDVLFTEMSEL
jgi:hypothetical protein